MKKHNFSAGPAILPRTVIEQAADAILNFNNDGLSILEISHRSPGFTAVLNEAIALVKELLNINDDYAVLFLTGGASTQFFMSALNLLDDSETGLYVDTGTWSSKAIKEAKLYGNIEVLASSKDKNYAYIPKGYQIPENGKYLHLTSNNTIFGTQIHEYPKTKLPFVCDMSSDIFSKPIDIKKFDLIYAGAQKNMGPAGTTLVIVKKEILGKVKRDIPTILNYETHISKNSSFNTPPVFPIYVSMLTMRWIKEQGGVQKMNEINIAKADLLYNEIDNNPLFYSPIAEEDRSLMNVTFLLKDKSKEEAFLAAATNAGCVGIKGHRSVGGFRASIYNSMSKESVQALVDVMRTFS